MTARVRLALSLVLLGAPVCLQATTIVPFSDAALVDGAPIIVLGRVVGQLPNTTDEPVTLWLVDVGRVLKGEVPPGAITVRTLGGETASGELLKIFGAPSFSSGEDVLLFLNQRPGGATYEVFQFVQGAFHKRSAAGRVVALQNLSEINVLEPRSGRAGRRGNLRDFDEFARWIEDRQRGLQQRDDYSFRPSVGDLDSTPVEYTIFPPGYRWFQFDSGGSVPWKNKGGIAGLSGAGLQEFRRAEALWTGEQTTPVKLGYAGTTGASAGFTRSDGQNVILFGDPNHEIPDVDCAQGGTLAAGGGFTNGSRGVFNGKSYFRISEGDIVVNNGFECLFPHVASPSAYVEYVFAHELGHTLGIAHSSESPTESNSALRSALMYYRVSPNTGRPSLHSDDIAALQVLYKKGSGGGGGGGGTPAPGGCPAGTPADTLCLVNGRFRVSATWENQYNSTSGAALPIPNSNLSGFFYFTDKTNVELIVKILVSGSNTQVFYSQLTDLHFVLTVTDTQTGRSKTYRNTAGDCGGLDESFDSGATGVATNQEGLVVGAATGICTTDARTLCLLENRFAITVDWRNQYDGSSGVGAPKQFTRFAGGFSFTNPANFELFIKTLQFPDNLLVIYGALSNLEYTIHVRDTTTGKVKDYHNAAGNFCGGLDNHAF